MLVAASLPYLPAPIYFFMPPILPKHGQLVIAAAHLALRWELSRAGQAVKS